MAETRILTTYQKRVLNDLFPACQQKELWGGRYFADFIEMVLAFGGETEWKTPCRAASVANVNVTTAPASLDGVTGAAGDRWLLKNQNTGAENGIYVFNGTGNALTRAEDANSDANVRSGLSVGVAEGTQADTFWTVTTENPIIVNTTAITFAQTFNAIVAGAGLTLVAGTLDVGDANKGVQVNADDVQVDASEIAGNCLSQMAGAGNEHILDFDGTNSSDAAGVTVDSGVTGATVDSGVTGVTVDSGVTGATVDSGVTGATVDSGVTGATVDSGVTGATVDNATATNNAETRTGQVVYAAPIAAELITISADAALAADGARVLTAGAIAETAPDVPRCLAVRVTIAVNAVTAGVLRIVGDDASGAARTEDVSLVTAISATINSTRAYSVVASATVVGLVGAGGAGDNLSVGVAAALGLPAVASHTCSAFAGILTAVAANVAGNPTREAVAGYDAANGTVTPTTAPDAARVFTFVYAYSITPTQAAHGHTVTDAGHVHTVTDAGHVHTVTDPTHTHTIS